MVRHAQFDYQIHSSILMLTVAEDGRVNARVWLRSTRLEVVWRGVAKSLDERSCSFTMSYGCLSSSRQGNLLWIFELQKSVDVERRWCGDGEDEWR